MVGSVWVNALFMNDGSGRSVPSFCESDWTGSGTKNPCETVCFIRTAAARIEVLTSVA